MDVDEDDDFYAPEESAQDTVQESHVAGTEPQLHSKRGQDDEDLEEGEEEDEEESGSDSDIDIITDRKDGSKPAPPSQAKYNDIRNIPQRTGSSEVVTKATTKKESVKAGAQLSGADLPGIAISKIDVDAKPIYDPAGKAITQVIIDEDLPENEKPWRRPGTDMTDYFNYGFDEFTWALYASKQESLRSEYNADNVAQNNKKMFEDMNMMMAMGGMPGMMPGAGGSGQMPGMEGMPAEMQQMMQQMMASGMDPSQMDPSAMFAAMQGNQNTAGNAQGGNQSQGFGGQAGFGQGQNQFFEQGGDTGGRRGGNFGRGKGRRGW